MKLPITAMNLVFFYSWKESDCDWLMYIGSPMVYDSALFVTR